jgi:hypothetical protein
MARRNAIYVVIDGQSFVNTVLDNDLLPLIGHLIVGGMLNSFSA